MRGCLLIVVLLGLGAFGGFYYFTSVARTTPPPLVVGTPIPIPTLAAGDKQVVLDEATLTREINSAVSGQSVGQTPLGDASISNVAVKLQSGVMIISGQAQAGGANVPMSISGSFEAQNGRAIVNVRDASLSGFSLPDAFKSQIQQGLQMQLDDAVKSNGLQVKAVVVDAGKLTMIGSSTR